MKEISDFDFATASSADAGGPPICAEGRGRGVEHPVQHLDLNLNTERYDLCDTLTDKLSLFLSQQEAVYGTDSHEKSLGPRFEGVIRRACEKTGQQIVRIGINFYKVSRNIEKCVWEDALD